MRRTWRTIKGALRLTYRATLVPLALVVCYGLYICGWPIARWSPARLRIWRSWCQRMWGWSALALLGIRLEIQGTKPKPPFLLVANHLSWVDILLFTREFGPVFVAMEEMATWPGLGWMLKNGNQIFINREDMRDSNRVIRKIDDALEWGEGVIVFAEARCSKGAFVYPFKPALFQAPATEGFPVHYAALTYETPADEPSPADTVLWWRWESLLAQFKRMGRMRRAKAIVRYGAAPMLKPNRKDLAKLTHAGVCELFTPVRPGLLEDIPPPAASLQHIYTEGRAPTRKAEKELAGK